MSPLLPRNHEIFHQHQHHHEVARISEVLDALRDNGAATLEGAARTAAAIGGDHALKLSAGNPLPITAQVALEIKEPILVKAALELPAVEHISAQLPRVLVAVYVLAGSIILSAAAIVLLEVLRR